MKRLLIRLLILVFAIALFSVGSTSACGPPEVCADISTSLAGTLDLDSITLEWSTDDETSSIIEYRLHRYNCALPSTCSTLVVTIGRQGSCGTVEDYDYVDTPPSPASSWSYYVEVLKTGGQPQCQIHTDPE